MKNLLKITTDEWFGKLTTAHRLALSLSNVWTPIRLRFFSILFIILFLGSCSDPFPKGSLFEFMILQKLVSGGTASNKYIFLTVGTYNGNLGGIAGADTKCQTEKTSNFANVPGAATEYKAFIVDGVTRIACTTSNCGGGILENVDWVLKANTDYYRLDGSIDTKIFTTNASGIVDFNGGASLLTAIDSNASTAWWTGLDTDWVAAGIDCVSWGGGGTGFKGNGGNTGVTSVSNLTNNCGLAPAKLLCVRQ